MNKTRSEFLLSGSALAITAFASGCSSSFAPSLQEGTLQRRASMRRAMSLPAGYTTTYSTATSSLYYNGSLVARVTTDPSTFLSSLYVAATGQTYYENSPPS